MKGNDPKLIQSNSASYPKHQTGKERKQIRRHKKKKKKKKKKKNTQVESQEDSTFPVDVLIHF